MIPAYAQPDSIPSPVSFSWIAVAERSNTLSIAVRDTGSGIDPADLDRIFGPFYRSSSQTRFPQGMGLGLSIAREIVTAHGGEITIRSQPGQGSTVDSPGIVLTAFTPSPQSELDKPSTLRFTPS